MGGDAYGTSVVVVHKNCRATRKFLKVVDQEITAAIPPGDERLFELALKVAADFRPLAEDETKKLLARAEGLKPIFAHGS